MDKFMERNPVATDCLIIVGAVVFGAAICGLIGVPADIWVAMLYGSAVTAGGLYWRFRQRGHR